MTILNWSFPRKDISRSAQAYQLALALRDEVADLEAAGCKVIQVGARACAGAPLFMGGSGKPQQASSHAEPAVWGCLTVRGPARQYPLRMIGAD